MATITKGIKQLCAEAEAGIETWTVDDALRHHGDDDVVFVDIRDVRELWREGAIPGAVHAPRGMLEFWVDPESPYARDVFQSGKRFMFFCAGGSDPRSPPRRCRTWASRRYATWRAASGRGKRRAAR